MGPAGSDPGLVVGARGVRLVDDLHHLLQLPTFSTARGEQWVRPLTNLPTG